MLQKPCRIPARFNRRVSPLTRRFVRRCHGTPRWYIGERMQRSFRRILQSIPELRRSLLPMMIITAAAVVLAGMAIVLFTPLMRVREIRIVRNDLRTDIEEVQRALAPLFRRHLFFLPRHEVVGMLKQHMPEIASVNVEKHYPSGLLVQLTLEPLIAKLRIDNLGAATGSGVLAGKSEYLDANGLYLAYNEAEIGTDMFLPTMDIVDWGVWPLPRSVLLSQDMLMSMRRAEQAILDQFGQAVRSRTVFLRAREFHVATNAHDLWFDMESPLDEQLERYRIFLQAAGKDAAKKYVDLRLRERVVYK